MDFQYIIVGAIIFAALFYGGLSIWRKLKSFSSKTSSCGSDCGCETKSKTKNSFVQIGKS